MRNEFFNSRGCEMRANIIRATLQDLGPGLWSGMTPMPNGDVVAETPNGSLYHFRWSVEEQRLQLVEHQPRVMVVELVA